MDFGLKQLAFLYIWKIKSYKNYRKKRPYEAYYGYLPRVIRLIIFASTSFSYVPKSNRRNIGANEIKFIFICYFYDYKT